MAIEQLFLFQVNTIIILKLESGSYTIWLHKTCGVFVTEDCATLIAVRFAPPIMITS